MRTGLRTPTGAQHTADDDGRNGRLHLHGEITAQIAVQTLTDQFQKLAKPRLADPMAFLADRPRWLRAPSTITRLSRICSKSLTPPWLLRRAGQHRLLGHVGDSRLYLFSDGA